MVDVAAKAATHKAESGTPQNCCGGRGAEFIPTQEKRPLGGVAEAPSPAAPCREHSRGMPPDLADGEETLLIIPPRKA